MSYRLYRTLDKIYTWLDTHPIAKKYLPIILLMMIIGLGVWLRALPAINYGLELHANDPWIEYWQANYTVHHGPLSWYSLTPANPDTHIFWYPWGRNFPLTSYPGLPIWVSITYPIVHALGLSVKDWVVLQPLVFAIIAFITIYLAAKEIMDGSVVAGLMAAFMFAVIPAASDRSIVGFVEKEGVALGFIFLFIYFYSKLAKVINKTEVPSNKKLILAIMASLSLASIGWFWGGYVYILGSVVISMVLYPLFEPKQITSEFLKYNIMIIVLSIVFVSVSPSILNGLGFYPKPHMSIGLLILAALILPIIYYGLGTLPQRKRQFKSKIPRILVLTPGKYFVLLIIIGIIGVSLIAMGIIKMPARYAYALGLRFVPAGPLVRSIEEHQPALVAHGLIGVLDSWGTGVAWLFFASPLILAILGAIYLLYKGGMDKVYLAIAFLVAFYAYMNATYFEAMASALGILVAAIFASYLFKKSIPTRQEIADRKRGRVRKASEYRIIASIIVALLFVNLAFSAQTVYQQHNSMVYSIMAGGAPINARTDAWYKTLDFLKKNLTDDSLVVSWWDYGYWISVGAHKATLADGATMNGTQIRLLARILTARNETEALDILNKLDAPINNTYILVFDVFQFIPGPNGTTYYVTPIFSGSGGIIGLVDIPKSLWMIRIGERNISDYLYLYVISHQATQRQTFFIAPRFDEPDKLPLIYKIMVDGILYLNYVDKNHTYDFLWYTGMVTPINPTFAPLERNLGIKYEVQVYQQKVLTFLDRPEMKYIKPYKIIFRPFEGIILQNGGTLMDVIFIYKVEFPPENQTATK